MSDPWIFLDKSDKRPDPGTEVYVLIDGHRGPSWRNNHQLVAYMDSYGNWWEERHPSKEPLVGVIAYAPLLEYPKGC